MPRDYDEFVPFGGYQHRKHLGRRNRPRAISESLLDEGEYSGGSDLSDYEGCCCQTAKVSEQGSFLIFGLNLCMSPLGTIIGSCMDGRGFNCRLFMIGTCAIIVPFLLFIIGFVALAGSGAAQ